MNSVWRFLLFSLLVCFRSAAQSDAPHPDLTKSLERQVRTMFSVPSSVNIKMSPLRPSQFPGYDAVSVKFDDPNNNSELEFLVAQDGKTLMRVIHVDLNKDPYAELMKKIDTSGRPTRGAKDAKVIGTPPRSAISASARGVKVRVLLNPTRGSGQRDNDVPYEALRGAGVGVTWTPPRFMVTHEKSVV